MVRGKKMGLGEFLGDQGAAYIPEASLPSGPRIRADDDDGRYDSRGPRGYDREPSRSDMSTQWRGDRGGDRFGDRGGDRFGDRGGDRFGDRGGDRFGDRGGDRFGGGDSWRGGGGDRGGPSRFDRPMRDEREPEERPAHMRLNLQRRTVEGGERDNAPRGGLGGGDKWSGAFSRGGDRGGDRFGDRGGDRFGDRGGDRFGDRGDRFGDRGDRFGDRGDRFGDRGDRFGDRGDRFGGDRFGDRGGDRFGRDGGVSNAFGNMRVSEPRGQQSAAPAVAAPTDKKALAQQKREERKKKAEEERLAAEAAKREAAEEKARAAEEAAKKTEADREVMKTALASGKKGEALAEAAKKVFADKGTPGGGAVVAAVTAAAEDVAKASANWIQPAEYGELLKLALAETDKKNQLEALNALQVFLNAHDFPKGVLEKCFMALYSLDIVEDAAFFEYKYDVDSDVPGRMKAIIQTSNWLTWLETPESESEEEDDE